MKKLLIILTLICFNASAKDNVMELPFNLKFGMTLNDLEKSGMQVELEKKDGNVETYYLKNDYKGWVNKSLIFFQNID